MTAEFDFSELDELYREIILDHYRKPRNKARLEKADISVEGFNPFCGDEVAFQVKLDGHNRVEQVGFQGQGCSISQASASMLTEQLKGKTLEEFQEIARLFIDMMHGKELTDQEMEKLGDLEVLQGVRKFPVRIKCALLGWSVMEEGLEKHLSK